VLKKCYHLRAAVLGAVIVTLLAGIALPGGLIVPVFGASWKDWHRHSFWYSPWGASGVHKGIDIFAAEGTPVISAQSGVVVYKGYLSLGGNVVAVLGPKWRIHYYAHLKTSSVRQWECVRRGQAIGAVGATGNAKGKPPHLHFAVITIIPYVWRAERGASGVEENVLSESG
jgi:murein DD-endopeptidase MepM/ murein hydrolase activator NlpD